MGLCKCPKRHVTNQFCFEHRVNVCENCMVTSHPKCIVQSYLQWLKDSDYNSSCTLCGEFLDTDECIRLICYHVFHWNCLNARQESLPATTAPGGHTCPSCSEPIFPPSNLVSPVADVLRSRLAQVNWGRNELGLPLLMEEKRENRPVTYSTTSSQMSTKTNGNIYSTSNSNLPSQHSVLNIDTFNANSNFHASSRRPLLAREPPIGASDRDENKYKRRTPAEIFSRWSRRLYSPSSRPPWRRTWFIVLAGLSFFLLIIYIMAKLGRGSIDNDSFNIENEPNLIHD